MGKWIAVILLIEWAILKFLITYTIPAKFIIDGLQTYPSAITFPLFVLSVMKIREILNKIDKPVTETAEKLKNNKSLKSIIDEHIPKESEEEQETETKEEESGTEEESETEEIPEKEEEEKKEEKPKEKLNWIARKSIELYTEGHRKRGKTKKQIIDELKHQSFYTKEQIKYMEEKWGDSIEWE